MKTSGGGISGYGFSLSLQPEVRARSQPVSMPGTRGGQQLPAGAAASGAGMHSRGMLPFLSFPFPPLPTSAAVIWQPLGLWTCLSAPHWLPWPVLPGRCGTPGTAAGGSHRDHEAPVAGRGCLQGAAPGRRVLPDLRAAESHPAVPPAEGAAPGAGRFPRAPDPLALRPRPRGGGEPSLRCRERGEVQGAAFSRGVRK